MKPSKREEFRDWLMMPIAPLELAGTPFGLIFGAAAVTAGLSPGILHCLRCGTSCSGFLHRESGRKSANRTWPYYICATHRIWAGKAAPSRTSASQR